MLSSIIYFSVSLTQPSPLLEAQNEAVAAAIEAAESKSLLHEAPAGAEAGEAQGMSGSDQQPAKKRLATRRGQEKQRFTKVGKVCFNTQYYPDDRRLEVLILRAFDLGKRKEHNYVNPFVRLYLLPGKRQKQHTRVQRRTKDPYFNDKRVFYELSESELVLNRLKLKVYSREAVKKNELLGEAEIALSSLNLTEKETYSLDLHMKKDEVRIVILSF